MAEKHAHAAKFIEQAAAKPTTHKSGEAAALKAAAGLVGCGPGPSLPLLPAPKVWHEVGLSIRFLFISYGSFFRFN